MKDALGSVQSILVLGGASEIGVAIAAELAAPRHANVVLAARRPDELDKEVAALSSAGAGEVTTISFDAADTASHEAVVLEAKSRLGDLDVVVVAFGLLGTTPEDGGLAEAVRVATTNYVGAVSVCLAVTQQMRKQGHGTLVVLSSVAAERVRKANFVYGSTKAGLDGFAQGLSDDLVGSGVSVLTVRPGFVVGRMTAGMKAAPFSTTPAAVATATAVALSAGKEIIWVPAVLRPVFSTLRHLPRPLWRRLPL